MVEVWPVACGFRGAVHIREVMGSSPLSPTYYRHIQGYAPCVAVFLAVKWIIKSPLRTIPLWAKEIETTWLGNDWI